MENEGYPFFARWMVSHIGQRAEVSYYGGEVTNEVLDGENIVVTQTMVDVIELLACARGAGISVDGIWSTNGAKKVTLEQLHDELKGIYGK